MTTTRGAGHLGPLIPLAHAFRRAGATVLVAAPRSAADMVRAEGLPTWLVDEPERERRDAIFATFAQRTPRDRAVTAIRDVFGRMDAGVAYPDLVDVCRRWRPDAVLSESCEFAGPLAAERMGVPGVAVAIGNEGKWEELGPIFADAMAELRARFGLREDPGGERMLSRPTFTLVPPGLDDAARRPAPTWRFREAGERTARRLPAWWPGDERPLVYVSFGSVIPTMDVFPSLYLAAIDAMSALPVRALVTIGRDRDPRSLGPVPRNVRIERWVPQHDVMPHAAAMVCHGGSGTVRMGLAAGVPMVVVPFIADQPWNAEGVAKLGAGIVVEPGAEIGARIREAVGRVLDEGSFRASAARAAAEVRALPPVDEAIGVLRGLIAARPGAQLRAA